MISRVFRKTFLENNVDSPCHTATVSLENKEITRHRLCEQELVKQREFAEFFSEMAVI